MLRSTLPSSDSFCCLTISVHLTSENLSSKSADAESLIARNELV